MPAGTSLRGVDSLKALIVAPFWRQQGHVGNYRIDRFVRWLAGAGVNVVLVRAGSSDTAKATDWGSEVTVADPLRLYVDSERKDATDFKPRTRSPLRRYLAYLVFNPDPTVVWARRAARHSLIMEQSKGVRWVISSNPPESCHVAAATLAKSLNAKLIIDM